MMDLALGTSVASWYAPENRRRALVLGLGLAALLAATNVLIPRQYPFGALYFLPILIMASFLETWQLVTVSLFFTVLREAFQINQDHSQLVARFISFMIGYLSTGLLIRVIVQNRQTVMEHLQRLQEQVELRHDAEEQLRVLVESSPAAIIIVDNRGCVLDCNRAADNLFRADPPGIKGKVIGDYLPVLWSMSKSGANRQPFRTKIETRARRADGEVFPADIWLSSYDTHSGSRLAAIVLDASEELREREEEGLHRLLSQSHIVAGAVWHEVRNLCAAIAVVHLNLQREGALGQSPDFQALGNLVGGLKNLASVELRPRKDTMTEEVSLQEILEDLRIVVGGQFAEADVELRLELSEHLPTVMAERYGLLQVFLNLAQNSLRAMKGMPERVLTVHAGAEGDRVVIRFLDTGRGIPDPKNLFQPFQRGAEVTGMGLYVSRAIVRDFLGDLSHEPQPRGCCFAVGLVPATVPEEVHV
jgi:two-component system sensor kinase FixL